MKTNSTVLLAFLILINLTSLKAGNSFKSKVSDDWYVKATIYYQGTAVKVIREAIPADTSVKSGIWNLTGLSWNDGKINFPDSGIYWFVPFNNDPPTMITNEVCWHCENAGNCSSGSCDWVAASGGCEICQCPSGSTSPCYAFSQPCEGGGGAGSERIGGGIIIGATSVQVVQVCESRLVDNTYCTITLRYDGTNAYYSKRVSETSSMEPGMSIYNFTNLPWIDGKDFDAIIQLPMKGRYWFIPFEPGTPVELQNGGQWCYDCRNSTSCNDQSTCDFRNGAGRNECKCANNNTSACMTVRCKCDGSGSTNNIIFGGGIILEANNLINY